MNVTRELPLAEIFPGSRLAADLYGPQGECLLAADTVLSEELLGRLAMQGVERLPVRSPEPSHAKAAHASALEALLDHRFRRVRGHPLMEALRETVLAHRLEGCA